MRRPRYAASALTHFTTEVLVRAGADPADAAVVAEALVTADLRGVHSHGVVRAGVYAARLRAGSFNPRARLRIVHDRGAVMTLDAQDGLGIVMAAQAMDLAIARAVDYGVGAVGVRNSNHCGMLAYFALRAVERQLVGVAMSNADAKVAPWGARARYLGTNPIAIAVPAGREAPIVLDMATSAVAHGRVAAAASRGDAIPEGWALDEHGQPTTDPHQALRGMLLPFGGAKGSGMSLIVDLLAGMLPGGRISPEIAPLYDAIERTQGVGHFFLALSIEAFVPIEQFAGRVDQMIQQIRALPPAPGHDRVYLPGEQEQLTMREYDARGIPLPEEVIAILQALAAETGVPMAASLAGVS